MTAGSSIFTLEIRQERASEFYLRVVWTCAFKDSDNLLLLLLLLFISVPFYLLLLLLSLLLLLLLLLLEVRLCLSRIRESCIIFPDNFLVHIALQEHYVGQ